MIFVLTLPLFIMKVEKSFVDIAIELLLYFSTSGLIICTIDNNQELPS